MRRVVAVGSLLLALLVAGAAQATSYNTADEAHVEQLVNGTRAGVGVKPLAHMAGLQNMAREQAVRMAERGDIYHNPNLSADITALGVDWRMVGENVGMGPDVDSVYKALLASPHHYENITRSNYTSIGVGEVNGPGPRVYLVQVFAQIVPRAPKPAPVRTPVRTVTAAPSIRSAGPVATVHHKPSADPNALFGGRVFRSLLP